MKLRKFIACENLREAQEKLLKNFQPERQLFRGDASSKYELVPSALRENNIERVHGLHGVGRDLRTYSFATYGSIEEGLRAEKSGDKDWYNMERGVGERYDGEPVFTTCSIPVSENLKNYSDLMAKNINMFTMFPTHVGCVRQEQASLNHADYESVFGRD